MQNLSQIRLIPLFYPVNRNNELLYIYMMCIVNHQLLYMHAGLGEVYLERNVLTTFSNPNA